MAIDRAWSNGLPGFRAPPDGADPAAAFAARTRRHTVRLSLKVSFAAIALAVTMWLVVALLGRHEQNAALSQARVEESNLTAVLADEIDQVMAVIDGTIRAATEAARNDPDALDIARLQAQLAGLTRPVLRASLVDAQGILRSGDGTRAPDPLGPSHFRELLDRKRPGALFVGRPVADPATRRVVLEISQRISGPDGTVLGAVVVSIPPEELTARHRSIDLGQHGTLGLVGLDGVVRARFHPGSAVPPRIADENESLPAEPPPGGAISFERKNSYDGMTRLVTLRRLPDYPLMVMVGLGVDDVLAVSHLQLWIVGTASLGLTILLGGLTGLLLRELWRRADREIALAREQGRLEAANAALSAERVKLGAANAELQASSRRAEAANRAKSRFMAQMSHELRTPLHAIIGFAEIIKDRPSSPRIASPVADYATQIWTAGRNLLEIINAILDIARIDAGTVQLSEANVRIGDVVRTSIAAVRNQAQGKQVALETDLPRELPSVRADPAKLRQILVNLLGNAVKFSPSGATVTISVRQDRDGVVVLAVTDGGIGMSQEEIAVALEPFGQVEGLLSRSSGGSGLGLPLAKGLAELHGGMLRVRSNPGSGTTVEVAIPACRVLRQAGGAIETPTPRIDADGRLA